MARDSEGLPTNDVHRVTVFGALDLNLTIEELRALSDYAREIAKLLIQGGTVTNDGITFGNSNIPEGVIRSLNAHNSGQRSVVVGYEMGPNSFKKLVVKPDGTVQFEINGIKEVLRSGPNHLLNLLAKHFAKSLGRLPYISTGSFGSLLFVEVQRLLSEIEIEG